LAWRALAGIGGFEQEQTETVEMSWGDEGLTEAREGREELILPVSGV